MGTDKIVEIFRSGWDFQFMETGRSAVGFVKMPFDSLTEGVIGAVFEVSKTLGAGF